MTDAVLVINAAASTTRFAVRSVKDGAAGVRLKGTLSRMDQAPYFTASNAAGEILADGPWDGQASSHDALLRELIDWIDSRITDTTLTVAGHRVVHGGTRFTRPVVIDPHVMDSLEDLIPLAPLHQPYNLAAIHALGAAHPLLPQVACFDTAFHAERAEVAGRFALPRSLHDAGIRRYGFHGLSCEYIARSLARLAPTLARGRVVIAHLGSGSSLCAMRAGKSVDSTMGFTALDGLPMATRCGSIDAGVLLFLMARGMGVEALQQLLYDKSGLLGVSGGVSGDVLDLLASDRPEAGQAVDLFVYRVVREIGAMAACLAGLDGLVFTAEIGERSPVMRERICRACAWLGIELDPAANARGAGCITTPASRTAAWVIPTDEEQMIALRSVQALRAGTAPDPRQELASV